MRPVPGVLALAAFLALAVGNSAAGDYIYVKEITMRLGEGNATFDLNYSLETFARLYVLALGCRYLEPDLLSLFRGCGGVKLLKADTDCAAVQVTVAGKYAKGCYLFEPVPLDARDTVGTKDTVDAKDAVGTGDAPLKVMVPRFTVISPEGRARTFYNVPSVQSVFWEAEAFSRGNASESSNGSIEGLFTGSRQIF